MEWLISVIKSTCMVIRYFRAGSKGIIPPLFHIQNWIWEEHSCFAFLALSIRCSVNESPTTKVFYRILSKRDFICSVANSLGIWQSWLLYWCCSKQYLVPSDSKRPILVCRGIHYWASKEAVKFPFLSVLKETSHLSGTTQKKFLMTVNKKEMIFVLPFRMEPERYLALLMN